MHRLGTFLAALVQLIGWGTTAAGAEIVFPQQRAAFFADQPIELAVSGLTAGDQATVEATAVGVMPVSFAVVGDGSTVTCSSAR